MRRIVHLIALAAVLGGCGAGPTGATGASPTPGGKRPFDQTRYVQCLREQGATVQEVDGGLRIEAQSPAQEAKNAAAKKACQELGPDGGEPNVPDAAQLEELLRLVRCLREHGLDVQDPGPPDYDIKIRSTTRDDSQIRAAEQACARR